MHSSSSCSQEDVTSFPSAEQEEWERRADGWMERFVSLALQQDSQVRIAISGIGGCVRERHPIPDMIHVLSAQLPVRSGSLRYDERQDLDCNAAKRKISSPIRSAGEVHQ